MGQLLPVCDALDWLPPPPCCPFLVCEYKFLVSIRSSDNFERGALWRFCGKRYLLSEYMRPGTRLKSKMVVVLGGGTFVGPMSIEYGHKGLLVTPVSVTYTGKFQEWGLLLRRCQ